jgi:restriction system protein
MDKSEVPQYHRLFNPLLEALHELGGSGTNDEIYETVLDQSDLSDEVAEVPHDSEKSNRTELEYRLAWARTYLKKYGLINNSERGVWVIKPEKRDTTSVDPDEVVGTVREQMRQNRKEKSEESDSGLPEEEETWRTQLHRVLTKTLSPKAFERLTKRLLRESGFTQVEVTGRSGDGGIDGKGIIQINGFLSFHIVIQCKRYQGSVSAGAVRDFRGAMVGKADKGLMITTGSFTRSAIREATRDGAPPIDLVDGDELAEKLKEMELGVETEVVEEVKVDEEWFEQI